MSEIPKFLRDEHGDIVLPLPEGKELTPEQVTAMMDELERLLAVEGATDEQLAKAGDALRRVLNDTSRGNLRGEAMATVHHSLRDAIAALRSVTGAFVGFAKLEERAKHIWGWGRVGGVVTVAGAALDSAEELFREITRGECRCPVCNPPESQGDA